MGLLDFDIMKLLVPDRVEKEPDKYCPVCSTGNSESHRIRVCWKCQKELLPEGEDQENDEEEIDHPSIADYNGFYHHMY